MKKIIIEKEKIIEAISTSKNVEEVLKKLDTTYGILYARCKEYNLSMEHFRKKVFINDDDFMKLYNLGYNDAQIGKELNIDSRRIQEHRKRKNLPTQIYRDITFSPEQYQIFIGGMYGDSYLSTGKDTNRLVFAHSLQQEEYCKWKHKKLENVMCKLRYTYQKDKRTGKIYPQIRAVSKTLHLFKQYEDLFYHYVNGKRTKYINADVFKTIDALGLAILFQDDGYKNHTGYGIATNCYTKEDIKIIQDVLLEKFRIHTTLSSSNTLYIPAKDVDLFNSIIIPYISKDCEYKLINSHCKTPLNKETPEKDNLVLNPQEIE